MRTVHRVAVAATVATLLGAGAVAGTGVGASEHSRAPEPAERAGIVASAKGAIPTADRGKYRIVGVRVSSRSRSWATATVTPKPAYRASLQGAYMVLVRSALTGRWTILDLGTAMVGCGIAPDRVLTDLGIGGECPPGQRL